MSTKTTSWGDLYNAETGEVLERAQGCMSLTEHVARYGPYPPKPCVELWTDGGASPNDGTGRGGWAAILIAGERVESLSGAVGRATSNQMELTAVLEGLKALNTPCAVTVHTDSQNVIGWLSQGWRRKNSQIADLCFRIEEACRVGGHQAHFEHVRGHSGNKYNEECHSLVEEARSCLSEGEVLHS